MQTSHTLSVIIPAYNEEDSIAQIVERVVSIAPDLQPLGIGAPEVIVVDDGSRDRTAHIVGGLAEQHPGVRLVRHAANHGYGAALKTGFKHASGDLLAFLDADGTYPPEYFPGLCRAALDGGELVIGSRMAGARSQMPRVRRLGNVIFATLVSLVGAQHVSDSASGMRVFRRDVLERLYPLPDGLNFTPVMSTRAIHENVRMVEVAIPYRERLGRSKLSVVRDGMRFLNSIVWTALSYNPVRILGALGLSGMGIAAIVAVAFVVLRLQGVTEIGAWGVFALYAAMVTGVTGISLFNLGAMFNYLVALFQKNPVRQGLFGRPIINPPLDRQFWWMGGLSVLAGSAGAVGTLAAGLTGWSIEHLWLWMLASAMLFLSGVQLLISWIVMRVLEEISLREAQIGLDMNGSETARSAAAGEATGGLQPGMVAAPAPRT